MYFSVGIVFILLVLLVVTLDLLFIPTFILTIVSVIGFFIYLGYGYSNDLSTESLYLALIFFGVTIIYLVLFFKFKLWEVFSLKTKLSNQEKIYDEIEKLDGESGIAISDLHPVGKVKINEKKYDAITKVGYIKENQSIIVTGKSGSQVVVVPKNEGD